MWLVLALAAAFLTSFLPIINKKLLTQADVSVVAFGVNFLSLPLLGIASVLFLPLPEIDHIFWLGVTGSGVLNLAATLMSTRALKDADASLVTPFLTFNPAFTLLVAYFALGETPGLLGFAGVLVIVAGGYLFTVEENRRSWWAPIAAMVRPGPILLAIVASFIWGLTPITEKLAIQHSDPQNGPLVAFASTAVMTLFLVPMISYGRGHGPLNQLRANYRGFLLAALIAGIAPVFGFTAFKLGLVGYVTAIFKLSSVMTVVWSALLLQEADIRQRLLGSGVMVAGALLVGI